MMLAPCQPHALPQVDEEPIKEGQQDYNFSVLNINVRCHVPDRTSNQPASSVFSRLEPECTCF